METVNKSAKKKQEEPGPELPTSDAQAGVVYIDFEAL
jgi:hypothetical protein